MHVLHLAFGGCLGIPPVRYGLTEDTGGHIAYVLGAVAALARRTEIRRVDVVTRAFRDDRLGREFSRVEERWGAKIRFLRLETSNRRYLAKTALQAEVPELTQALIVKIASMQRPPDLVHAHFGDAAQAAVAVRDRFGIPVVYTPHSLSRDPRTSTRSRAESEAIAEADAVVVSSRDEMTRQVEAFRRRPRRLVCLPPGVTLPEAACGTGLAERLIDDDLAEPAKPVVIAIARPVRKKNLRAVLQAYASCSALNERANLAILAGQWGSDPHGASSEQWPVIEELRLMARDPKLSGRVSLPPRHPPEAVPQVYRLAARRRGIFVNVAHHEPFGLTLIEAASFGLPFVATSQGGPRSIAETLGTGELVAPSDIGGIGAAMLGLITDRGRWDAASAAARRNVRAYDWNAWADGAAALYRSLVGPARRSRPSSCPALLATDLDGTLTGCRQDATQFSKWASRRPIPWMIATGRAHDDAQDVLARWGLPRPDALIAAVGTEIYWPLRDGGWRSCPDFAALLDQGWDREAAMDALRRAGAALQPEREQRRWKLAASGTAADGKAIEKALAGDGLCARVVASHGRFIDVLAPRGGKLAAVAFAAERFGVPLRGCVAAGDSGNDTDMLLGCGHAIVVANAWSELSSVSGPRIVRTDRPHAGGVLEGLRALGLGGPSRDREWALASPSESLG